MQVRFCTSKSGRLHQKKAYKALHTLKRKHYKALHTLKKNSSKKTKKQSFARIVFSKLDSREIIMRIPICLGWSDDSFALDVCGPVVKSILFCTIVSLLCGVLSSYLGGFFCASFLCRWTFSISRGSVVMMSVASKRGTWLRYHGKWILLGPWWRLFCLPGVAVSLRLQANPP